MGWYFGAEGGGWGGGVALIYPPRAIGYKFVHKVKLVIESQQY